MLMLNKINQNLYRRLSAAPSSIARHRKTMSHTAESISAIFLRPPSERSKNDYEDIHRFMGQNIRLF